MAKRGLLIGCNYPGSEHALRGCCNDVKRIKEVLTKLYGFRESDLIVLMDDEPGYVKPTGHAIKTALKQLVDVTQPGDALFIHYSGHGTQVPNKGSNDEADNKDEALVPTDMNLILDDDLKVLLSGLKQGVNCTFISDCCHSGSMLDGGHHAVSGPKQETNIGFTVRADTREVGGNRDVQQEGGNGGGLFGCFKSCLGQTLDDNPPGTTKREIPMSAMLQILMQMAQSAAADGKFDLNDVGSIMSGLFGGNASVKYNSQQQQCASSGGVGDDRMVLISGCQDHETSADCPAAGGKPARGALTDALATVLEQWHQEKGKNINNRDLVLAVRNVLIKQRIAQNPCLEASEENANQPFIFFNSQ